MKDELKKFFCIFAVAATAATIFAENHVSVPVDDPVYPLLDTAQIRGLCDKMTTVRPHSLAVVLDALTQIAESPDSSGDEAEIARAHIERLEPSAEKKFLQSGAVRHEGELKDGAPNNIAFSFATDTEHSANANTGDYSGNAGFYFNLSGDLSAHFSYKLNLGIGLGIPGRDALSPFSFSQQWDGYRYLPPDFHFGADEDVFGFWATIKPELCAAFFDGKVGINFSRVRRDWGIGDGNLMLTKEAQPFMAFDMYFRPFRWVALSFVYGGLEYISREGIKDSAWNFQNNYAATKLEFFVGRYIYLGLDSSVVLPKRFELGYMNPANFFFFYQNSIGDFDNMQLGASIAANVPKHAQVFFNVFLDEIDLRLSDFFHRERCIFAFQAGAKVALPLPFASILLQYTKIEPYMYTHAPTEVPWYGDGTTMDTGCLNHGEPLGYHLDPNSDEVKLKFAASPLWFLTVGGTARLVRHGITSGGGDYTTEWTYDDLDTKDFLKDGIYEWIYSVALTCDVNMRRFGLPFNLICGYEFYYRDLTDWQDGEFKHVGEVQSGGKTWHSGCNNLFSLGLRLF